MTALLPRLRLLAAAATTVFALTCASVAYSQTDKYVEIDHAIDCMVETSGVFGDNNTIMLESAELSSLECWPDDKREKAKRLALRSTSVASGFIETRDFGRVKIKVAERGGYDLSMRKIDQAKLLLHLRK